MVRPTFERFTPATPTQAGPLYCNAIPSVQPAVATLVVACFCET